MLLQSTVAGSISESLSLQLENILKPPAARA
jgi:hypothetical protein